MMKPFVKWAGGKRQISDIIIEKIHMFTKFNSGDYTFHEPFVGGGSIFIKLKHDKTIINDLNNELINAYKIVKDNPKKLIEKLSEHKKKYNEIENYYYDIRKIDRDKEEYNNMEDYEKAARTIFLNKTCYNGLYRVNLRGEFNTPEGKYKNPSIYEEENIYKLSSYFSKSVEILSGNYKDALMKVKKGDIIYVDPPYDYGGENGFTGYQKEGFTFDDFKELKKMLDKQISKGAYVIISNNATDRVIELFENDINYEIFFNIEHINTLRTINSNGSSRKSGKEIIILGYGTNFPEDISFDELMKIISTNNIKIYEDDSLQKYLNTLRYLGLITNKKNFTKKGKKLKKSSNNAIKKYIYNELMNKEVFKEVFNMDTTEKDFSKRVKDVISNKFENYSKELLEEKVKITKKWVSYFEIN
ncbi:DNA adenine methylase [Haploplasma modicum]|uniref:DNA adenine methylase n=1 Tax=Haploplasma modicum TaxID=2150 RepID=UPI000691892F|nr:Dam family site-specific DNA-(adenine-N6)-methyltransferase [Haploplasma modicum]